MGMRLIGAGAHANGAGVPEEPADSWQNVHFLAIGKCGYLTTMGLGVVSSQNKYNLFHERVLKYHRRVVALWEYKRKEFI